MVREEPAGYAAHLLLQSAYLLIVCAGLVWAMVRARSPASSLDSETAGPVALGSGLAAMLAAAAATGLFVADPAAFHAGAREDGALEWASALLLLGGSAIPISIGVAVVRYRLYEIDRLVSRTVSYAIVIALLAAVFAGLVTLVGSFLDTASDLAVAASTLAVAALFNPLRRRVQRGVDHRFNRSRYDSERVMSGFTSSLRDEVDPDEVLGGWLSVVINTMQPASVGAWVRTGP